MIKRIIFYTIIFISFDIYLSFSILYKITLIDLI